jgi:hypothetical protein
MPNDTAMEARIAVLEEIAVSTRATLKDLRNDLRTVRARQEADFRILFAALIGVALGMAGLVAKGFHWV